jgi:ABC-type lipoprotein release transport system permease subunit
MLGWRYTRRPRHQRNGFSFISGVSMLGIALGVAGTDHRVPGVMNGFQKKCATACWA